MHHISMLLRNNCGNLWTSLAVPVLYTYKNINVHPLDDKKTCAGIARGD